MASLLAAVALAAPAVWSVCHYCRTRPHLNKDVPVHFGVDGVPDRFAPASYFLMYPCLSVTLGTASVAATYLMTAGLGVLFALAMTTSLVILCVAQSYSAAISRETATHIPQRAVWGMLVAVATATLALIVYSFVSLPAH